jgi:hypothetical protein
MSELPVETESPFAQAIQDHLELQRRNADLEDMMPLGTYAGEDPFLNHPLFKSEEQARVEETLHGEPLDDITSERLPWPGETALEGATNGDHANGEGAALDEALWSGRPRDFDWGD